MSFTSSRRILMAFAILKIFLLAKAPNNSFRSNETVSATRLMHSTRGSGVGAGGVGAGGVGVGGVGGVGVVVGGVGVGAGAGPGPTLTSGYTGWLKTPHTLESEEILM